VRSAISGVVREAVIAAVLTGVMILLFIGSWRSSLIIAISIPFVDPEFDSGAQFSTRDNQHNDPGRVGVSSWDSGDDAHGYDRKHQPYPRRRSRNEIRQAILDGAQQIAVPALVSTVCICIVFMPLFLLGGVARYLFVPLAEAVVFAMLASYILSRTLVPTLVMYMIKLNEDRGSRGSVRALSEEIRERL